MLQNKIIQDLVLTDSLFKEILKNYHMITYDMSETLYVIINDHINNNIFDQNSLSAFVDEIRNLNPTLRLLLFHNNNNAVKLFFNIYK